MTDTASSLDVDRSASGMFILSILSYSVISMVSRKRAGILLPEGVFLPLLPLLPLDDRQARIVLRRLFLWSRYRST